MVRGSILHQEDRTARTAQDAFQKADIGRTVQLAGPTLIKQASGKEVNGAKHFVGFALAGGLDERLLADGGPGVTQTAPLRETGLVAKQQQAMRGLSLGQYRGPGVLQ